MVSITKFEDGKSLSVEPDLNGNNPLDLFYLKYLGNSAKDPSPYRRQQDFSGYLAAGSGDGGGDLGSVGLVRADWNDDMTALGVDASKKPQ